MGVLSRCGPTRLHQLERRRSGGGRPEQQERQPGCDAENHPEGHHMPRKTLATKPDHWTGETQGRQATDQRDQEETGANQRHPRVGADAPEVATSDESQCLRYQVCPQRQRPGNGHGLGNLRFGDRWTGPYVSSDWTVSVVCSVAFSLHPRTVGSSGETSGNLATCNPLEIVRLYLRHGGMDLRLLMMAFPAIRGGPGVGEDLLPNGCLS